MRAAALLLGLAACGDNLAAAGDAADADADANVEPPSCVSLPATCGAMGSESCCESLTVVGGTFYRGYDVAPDMRYAQMTWPATVSTFRLDKYEVTVGRFRRFVDTGMGTQASPPTTGAGSRTLDGLANQGGWDPTWNESLAADTTALVASVNCDATLQEWTDTPAGNENLPMGCITWFEAMAFCIWDGGYLPTEAESMYAASGGSQQRAYPWSTPPDSTAIDCTMSNHVGCGADATNVGSTSPQGDGMWGHADLGGNLWEWVLDWFGHSLLNPCVDCANLVANGPQSSPFRVIHGGAYVSGAPEVRVGFRIFLYPPNRGDAIGVRCARPVM